MKKVMTAKEIRRESIQVLSKIYGFPDESLIIDEMEVGVWGKVGRADLVLLCDDYLVGVEIKASTDNLKRLETQVKAYSRVFDDCWVSVHEKHWPVIRDAVPDSWGVLVCRWREDDSIEVGIARGPSSDHSPIARAMLERIWSVDVKKIASMPEVWGDRIQPDKWVIRQSSKSHLMNVLLADADDDSLLEIRRQALYIYRDRRLGIIKKPRHSMSYGMTRTLGEELSDGSKSSKS